MVAYWLWTSRTVGSHFADSEQVKNVAVIFVTLNKSKNLGVIFSDFDQVEKLVLLTLGRLSYFSDGCLLDNCFLDDCFLNGLWTRQKRSSYFVEFEQIQKNIFHDRRFICKRCSWQSAAFFYIMIYQYLFLPVRTHFYLCFLSAKTLFHLKHQHKH